MGKMGTLPIIGALPQAHASQIFKETAIIRFALNIRVLMTEPKAGADYEEACREEGHAAAGQGVPPTHLQSCRSRRDGLFGYKAEAS